MICNKMVILIVLLLLQLTQPHLIISVTPSNQQVNANDQLAIQILTSAAIPANALTLSLTTDFALAPPCLINGTTATCTYATTSSAVSATFTAAFATNTYYLLTLTATNPPFASNFPLTAAAASTPFADTGLITINPKTISCSMTTASQYVGDNSVGYFSLTNDPLPSGSSITINSSLQTTFANLFTNNPSCSFRNTSAPCALAS
jgi:hypothetical protein